MCKVQEPPPVHHGRTRKRKRPIIRTVKPIQPILCILSMEHNRWLCYSCIENSSYIKKENDHAGNQ